MFATNDQCKVYYYPGLIVLKGPQQSVHMEAHNILKRYAYSAIPYRVVEDRGNRVVLAPTS
jgi:hypothetical protein